LLTGNVLGVADLTGLVGNGVLVTGCILGVVALGTTAGLVLGTGAIFLCGFAGVIAGLFLTIPGVTLVTIITGDLSCKSLLPTLYPGADILVPSNLEFLYPLDS